MAITWTKNKDTGARSALVNGRVVTVAKSVQREYYAYSTKHVNRFGTRTTAASVKVTDWWFSVEGYRAGAAVRGCGTMRTAKALAVECALTHK